MAYVGRFAPSPTGPLHLGSLVAAVGSYLDARHAGGTWLVRMEDVDATRCRPEHAAGILDTLAAFGLAWDGEVMVQTQRTAAYEEALGALAAGGHLYACACSRREIADSALAGIDGPVYPGTCRARGLPAPGNAMRFRAPAGEVVIPDRLQGEIRQDVAREVGDFVLKRRDGLHAYQLAVVVDDARQGVTDVVRGADLLDSTPRQVLLQQALGAPTPRYLHLPVAVNAAGQKLSKQTLAPAVSGDEAMESLRAVLAFLGQPHEHASARTPAGLLAAATAAWDVGALPARRAMPLP